jgi:hypothetical protein
MAERRRAPAKRAATSTHEVQAAAEGVEIVGDGRKVSLLGAEFRMADKIGLMPLLKLAHAGKQGVDVADDAGMVAMYEVIRDCIDATEWDRFQNHATETKAEAEDLMNVVTDVIQALSARPTGSPSSSSAGRRQISGNSKASSPRMATPPPEDFG